MGYWAILEITDGTDAGTVSLLSSAVGFNLSSQAPLVTSIGASLGVHLKDWRPAIAQPKGGGVWQDSPLSSLRQNVHSVLATSNEVFNLKINGEDQDSLIFVVQEFLRLLLQARDYWKTDWQNTIVYLKAQAKCETNPRYAEIRGFTIQELENPYGELFFNTMLIAAMDNITLGIERGHWGADIPGESTCVQADGTFLSAFPEAVIAQSTDDVWVNHDTPAITTGSAALLFGFSTPFAEEEGTGLRFLPAIPQGTTIQGAFIRFVAQLDIGSLNDLTVVIDGEDNGNAATFSTYANYAGRTKTSASVNWVPPAFLIDVLYDTPDISSIVQEIVDRADWSSGNGMAFFIELATGSSLGERVVKSFDHADDPAPILIVRYTQGRGATCTNEVYIANKLNVADINFVKTEDNSLGAFADIYRATLPVALFSGFAQDDATYFGISPLVGDNSPVPFANVVFDIDANTSSNSFIWEYSQGGGGWGTLSVRDGTEGFDVEGVSSVHWEQPSDWIADTVDGDEAFWVRVRVTSVIAGTPPDQQNRQIYTVIQPHLSISAAQVGGDIPAKLQINVQNQSDEDGPGGDAPDLWDNRVIVGLRSESRGTSFVSHLNAADTQNPDGIAVSLGTNTSFEDSTEVAAGRRVAYNPVGSEDMADRVTFSFDPTIAFHFRGLYHVFLRGQRLGGIAADISVRLQVATGSGGIIQTTESKQFQTVLPWELIDIGPIALPASGLLRPDEIGDSTRIVIQASGASGIYVPDLFINDLIIIPVDEWAGDFVDGANEDDSDVGRSNDLSKRLEIDSVTFPKRRIRGIVKTVEATASQVADAVTSIYRPITNGPAILQANAAQRLFFLIAQTDQTGFDPKPNWISPPEIAHSIQLFHNAQYLGMRGKR